jgi:hypothetical protein
MLLYNIKRSGVNFYLVIAPIGSIQDGGVSPSDAIDMLLVEQFVDKDIEPRCFFAMLHSCPSDYES